jgi:superfamily II DNA or RNA helicase
MVAKIIQELSVAPFIFYVLTRDLMYQSKKVLERSIPGIEVGVIGDGVCDIKDINVMTIQTATAVFAADKKELDKELKELKESAEMDDQEYKEFKKENLEFIKKRRNDIMNLIGEAKGIYADEVHHFAAETCKRMLLKSPKAYYRFGGSATPERADNAYLTIEGLFGRQTAVVTASDLIKRGFLLKPNIKFIKLETRKQIVNTFAEDRSLHIVNNAERNDCIVRIANDLIRRNISTMILVQIIEHGKMLEKLIPGSVFVHGDTKKEKRADAIAKLGTGEIKCLIGSTIADEGLDVPTLSALIMAGGGKSSTKAKQRVGRVIRLGSPYAYVFDFIDVGKWTKKHSNSRITILQQEPEFQVEVINSTDLFYKTKELF